MSVDPGIDKQKSKNWHDIGMRYYKLRDYEMALQAIDLALELDSRNTNYLVSKAQVHFEIEEYTEALETLDKVLIHNADNQKVRILRKVIIREQKLFRKLNEHGEIRSKLIVAPKMLAEYATAPKINLITPKPIINSDYSKNSILNKSIMSLLTMDEINKDKLCRQLESVPLCEACDISATDWDTLNRNYVYQDDSSLSMFSYSIGFIATFCDHDSQLFDKLIGSILKPMNLQINETYCINDNEPIISPIGQDILLKLPLINNLIEMSTAKTLKANNLFKWSDLCSLSENDIIKKHGVNGESIILISLINKLDFAKHQIIKILSPVSKNKEMWQSFETLFETIFPIKSRKNLPILYRRLNFNKKRETLDSIAQDFGLTRERIRQIEKKLRRILKDSIITNKIEPLWFVIESLLLSAGNFISLQKLSKEISDIFGWQKTDMNLLSLIISSNPKFKLHHDMVGFNDIACCICTKLADVIDRALDSQKKMRIEQLREKIQAFCANSCLEVTHDFEFGETFFANILRNNDVKIKGNFVFSDIEWHMRESSLSDKCAAVLKMAKRALHHTDISQMINEYSNIDKDKLDKNVYASLERNPNVAIWGRGTYIHNKYIKFPYRLIREIEDWLTDKLLGEVPFVSAYGAYISFEKQCLYEGIPDEYALYSCLRKSQDERLVLPHLPYVYLSDHFTNVITTSTAIEKFISTFSGEVSLAKVEDYAINSLYLKEFMLPQLFESMRDVYKSKERHFIHKDNLKINHHKFLDIVQYTVKYLSDYNHASIKKIFFDKRVSCLSIGIDNPILLFSLFRMHAADVISADRYPQIKLYGNAHLVKSASQSIVDYIRDKKRACAFSELEDHFIKKLGYSEQLVNAISYNQNVYRYASSSLIHNETLGWNDHKQDKLELVADGVFSAALSIGSLYGLTEAILDSPDLPLLDNDVIWSNNLLIELLIRRGNFKMLGNTKKVFIQIPNKLNINTFEDYLYEILSSQYNGATSLSRLEADLQSKGLVKRMITKGMLGDSKKVDIVNKEIMLTNLVRQ